MNLAIRIALGVALLFAIAACSSAADETAGQDAVVEGGTDGATPLGDAAVGTDPCANGTRDGTETDVDCGGNCAAKCESLKGCATAVDCVPGLVCVKSVCVAASATDGVKDGDETDVDCGGTAAPACGDGKGCKAPTDCTSSVCTGGVCQPPTSTDGVKNGTETDIDCGGAGPTNAPGCATGKACAVTSDCDKALCTAAKVCAAPASDDGIKNGTETDVDCGGGAPTGARRCATGEACLVVGDCDAVLCTAAKVCASAANNDGIKNGTETDIDCGGAGPTFAAACATGKSCLASGDCASDGCSYLGKCAPYRSCTRQRGGDTCGRGEDGDPALAHESCCATAALPSGAKLDKYLITAGRMRAFAERTGGNVLAYVQTLPANHPFWNQAWNPLVPASMDDFLYETGPAGGSGCQNSNGANIYWKTDAQDAALGDTPHKLTQDQLDIKAQNCTQAILFQAFCVWDGGRLATFPEFQSAWLAGENRTYPWGNAPVLTSPADPTYMVYLRNYSWPTYTPALGETVWIPGPGRTYNGYGKYSHADLAGVGFEMFFYSNATSFTAGYSSSGSWDVHGIAVRAGGTASGLGPASKYWAFFGRCTKT